MSNDNNAIVVNNPWSKLRQYTPARIALGRAGTSLPTKPHLEFQLAHARARNAVHHELNIPALQEALQLLGHEVVVLHSAAGNRPVYLQRPDKGRRLDQQSRTELEGRPRQAEPFDVVFVIGDGLSALAIEENAAAFLGVMSPALSAGGWRVAPLVVVKEARVAVGDEVGEVLGAGIAVVLIGERPGLSSPDSMGIYMTLKPRVGLTDEVAQLHLQCPPRRPELSARRAQAPLSDDRGEEAGPFGCASEGRGRSLAASRIDLG